MVRREVAEREFVSASAAAPFLPPKQFLATLPVVDRRGDIGWLEISSRTVTQARRNSAPYSGAPSSRCNTSVPGPRSRWWRGSSGSRGTGCCRRSAIPRLGTAPGYSSERCGRRRATALAKDCMPETTQHDAAHRDSLGSVEGLVNNLAQGHAAKFAVYPDDASCGTPCYLGDKDEARMAGLRRKRVRVTGLLRRDLCTGLPLSIRDVTNIEVLEPPVADLRDLWGVLPTVGNRKPEEIIRAAWPDV